MDRPRWAGVIDIPRSVTRRQAQQALRKAGLLDAVEAAIDALPSPEREFARDEWEKSTEVLRDRGLVIRLGAALGLTQIQIDALFLSAKRFT